MRRVAVAGAFVGFVVLALAFALVSPPFENPDEMSHAEYAAFLGTEGRLPDVLRDCIRLAFHPPLYHLLLAPIARAMAIDPEAVMTGHRLNPAFEATRVLLVHGHPDEVFPFAGVSRFVFAGRLVSILAGVGVLLYTHRLARLASDGPLVPLVAVAVVATIPQFAYLAASFNHDALAACCAAAMLFHAARLTTAVAVRPAVGCGVAFGLGLLTKSSLVPLAVLPAAAVSMAPAATLARRIGAAAIAYAIALATAGWWYARNDALYGSVLPIVDLHRRTWIGAGLVHHGAIDAAYVGSLLDQLFRSFWFLAGLMNVAAPAWMYRAWGALALLAAVGLGLLLRERVGRLLAGAWLVVLAGVVHYALQLYSAQGRYLFVVVPVFALALARPVVSVPRRLRAAAAGALVLVLFGLAGACFLGSFAPTYARGEARVRPDVVDTARLCCRTRYEQTLPAEEGVLRAVVVEGRRVGAGAFTLHMTLRRLPGGEIVRRARASGASLGTAPGAVRLGFAPLATREGETYAATFVAPAATPVSKPALRVARDPARDGGLRIDGVPTRGRLMVRAEYADSAPP